MSAASLSGLHAALRRRDVDESWEISCRLPYVPLRFAIRLVALLADENDARYDVAARRFLIRALGELDPRRAPLDQVKKLVDILAHVHHYYWQHEARIGLQDVVGQMHQRDVRLQLEFDSEGALRRSWR